MQLFIWELNKFILGNILFFMILLTLLTSKVEGSNVPLLIDFARKNYVQKEFMPLRTIKPASKVLIIIDTSLI